MNAATLTRGARICYDLRKTPYKATEKGYTFCFSSQKHLEKFLFQLIENRKTINKSLSKRFGFDIELNTLADIVLYRRIETRGFLLYNENGVKITWQKLLINGAKPEAKPLQKM